jgi:hypothetical protein
VQFECQAVRCIVLDAPPAGVIRYVVITVGAVALIAHLLSQNVSHVQLEPACARGVAQCHDSKSELHNIVDVGKSYLL